MSKFLTALMLLLLASPIAAQQVFYQWRDSNNTLHVSQVPPQGVTYETKMINSNNNAPLPQLISTTAAKAGQAVQPDQPAQPAEPVQPADLTNQQNCHQAQQNLTMLLQDLPVYLQDDQGNNVLLTPEQRDKQLQLAKKQQQFYCDQSPAKPVQ